MATEINTNGGGGSGNVLLSFLMGAVLVVVAIVGFFLCDKYNSHQGAGPAAVHITVKGK